MIRFACTACATMIDTDRDAVRVPHIDAQRRIGRSTIEYRCAHCQAVHALRFRPSGVLAYAAAAPLMIVLLAARAPELAAGLGSWLGRVAYTPVQTAPAIAQRTPATQRDPI